MGRSIALKQTNLRPLPDFNPYSSKAQKAAETLIDGQRIDEAGKALATNLMLGDRREQRILRAEAASTVAAFDQTHAAYRLILLLPDSPLKQRIIARQEMSLAIQHRNMQLDRELWQHNEDEDAGHVATGDFNPYSSKAQKAAETLIDGQRIDEAGKALATNLIQRDRHERRVLHAEATSTVAGYDETRAAYRLILELPDSELKQQIIAHQELSLAIQHRNMRLDRELWQHNEDEDAGHVATGDFWDDSRANRREACAILDDLQRDDLITSEPAPVTTERARMVAETSDHAEYITARK